MKTLSCGFTQGKQADGSQSVLMPGEYRIVIGHAPCAFVVEEPPFPHFSLERAHGVCAAQGWRERFLDLKRLAEGRERVNSMHLITERAKPITNRPLQKPSARR